MRKTRLIASFYQFGFVILLLLGFGTISFADGEFRDLEFLNLQSPPCESFEHLSHSCQLAIEYRQILVHAQNLSRQRKVSISPLHFRNAMAPRFINMPQWNHFLSSQTANKDPRFVYDPKPLVWDNWAEVTSEVHKLAFEHKPLTMKTLLGWNREALRGTLVAFEQQTGGQPKAIGTTKKYPNAGSNLEREIGLSYSQIKALTEIEFANPKHKIVWESRKCSDEIPDEIWPSEFTKRCKNFLIEVKLKKSLFMTLAVSKDVKWVEEGKVWENAERDLSPLKLKPLPRPWFWQQCWPEAETRKDAPNCGLVKYLEPADAVQELSSIVSEINTYLANPKKAEDPLRFARRIQQRFVGAHPFNRGNGRGSRWVMDYITLRLGLPPILFENMDYDLTVPQQELGVEGVKGARESLRRMKVCLKRWEREPIAKLQNSECGLVGE